MNFSCHNKGKMKNFGLLIAAQGCSLTGGYIQTLVLSWLAASTKGGVPLAWYMIACYLPVAAFSYPLGRFLDRKKLKPWLLGSELGLAGLSLFLWLAAVRDWITFPFLLVFGGIWGCVRALQTPIYQSLPKRLSKDLKKGTALLTAVTCAARGLGPILGGLLYAKWGAAVPFFVNFCSFVPSVLLLCFLRIPLSEQGQKPRLKPWLLPLLRIFAVGFFGVQYNVTFVALIKEAGKGSAAYGIALGLLGAGALIGFWIKTRFKKELPLSYVIGGMGLLNLLLLLRWGMLWQGSCILLYGVLDFWFFAQSSYRLSRAAKGRELTAVMGLYTVATVGALPLGALLWSVVSKAAGLSVVLLTIGGGLLLLSIIEKRINQNEQRIRNF